MPKSSTCLCWALAGRTRNGTISPYLLTLAYRYVSAIVPLNGTIGEHFMHTALGLYVDWVQKKLFSRALETKNDKGT